jgi:MFS family permease
MNGKARDSRAVVVGVLCLAEALVLIGTFTFPALLPDLAPRWSLSATDAGWISGLFFGGYTLAVPGLMMLTDRLDAKRVFVAGALFSAVAHALFALIADGFWTAALLRTLAGAGLAGVYMPGVKALADRIGGPTQGRAVAFYTSTFSLGTAASFAAAGWASALGGPLTAFWVAAVASLAAAVLVAFGLKSHRPARAATSGFDIRPVLRNRQAMGFVLAYGVHAWELFGLRSWAVAFLVFAQVLSPGGPMLMQPTTVAAVAGLIAMVSSIAGQEASMRFGRARVASIAMLLGSAIAIPAAFTATLGYGWAIAAVLVWMAVIQADSAVLTAGTVASAEDGRRGATLAVHASVGFTGAMLGPLVMGIALDGAAGDPLAGWVWAFATLALVSLLGPLALRWANRPTA